jgi:hypothetical protein
MANDFDRQGQVFIFENDLWTSSGRTSNTSGEPIRPVWTRDEFLKAHPILTRAQYDYQRIHGLLPSQVLGVSAPTLKPPSKASFLRSNSTEAITIQQPPTPDRSPPFPATQTAIMALMAFVAGCITTWITVRIWGPSQQ